MSDNKITSDLLRGHTDTMILRLLSEADRDGYEIVKLIVERSAASTTKGSYHVLQRRRLEEDGEESRWYWGDENPGWAVQDSRMTEKGRRPNDPRTIDNWTTQSVEILGTYLKEAMNNE